MLPHFSHHLLHPLIPSLNLLSLPSIEKKVIAFAKAKNKSLAKACKKGKLDETLERKEALELEEDALAFFKALSTEEHKKLVEDAKIVALVGKLFEEIPNKVIL